MVRHLQIDWGYGLHAALTGCFRLGSLSIRPDGGFTVEQFMSPCLTFTAHDTRRMRMI